jgi:chromosome segregation ATPase
LCPLVQTLEDEIHSLKLQVDSNPEEPTSHQTGLEQATERARHMVSNATSTMMLIQAERQRNRELRQAIDATERALNESAASDASSVTENLQRAQQIQKVLDEYTVLLRDIFASPTLLPPSRYASKSDRCSVNIDTDLLKRPVRDIVERVLELPRSYSTQDLPTKRAIVQGLICSLEASNSLTAQIHDLERRQAVSKTPRRIGIDISVAAAELFALQEGIKRFSFA